MSYDFNINDVLIMAENIEKKGIDFYNEAASNINDKELKNFLISLALMEQEHKDFFFSMRSNLEKNEKNKTIFDLYSEEGQYLKALSDVKVFFEKKIDLNSLESILKTAIEAEKDSIIFYLGIKNLVPIELGKKKIDKIISEEMKHIKLLSNFLVNLKNRS